MTTILLLVVLIGSVVFAITPQELIQQFTLEVKASYKLIIHVIDSFTFKGSMKNVTGFYDKDTWYQRPDSGYGYIDTYCGRYIAIMATNQNMQNKSFFQETKGIISDSLIYYSHQNSLDKFKAKTPAEIKLLGTEAIPLIAKGVKLFNVKGKAYRAIDDLIINLEGNFPKKLFKKKDLLFARIDSLEKSTFMWPDSSKSTYGRYDRDAWEVMDSLATIKKIEVKIQEEAFYEKQNENSYKIFPFDWEEWGKTTKAMLDGVKKAKREWEKNIEDKIKTVNIEIITLNKTYRYIDRDYQYGQKEEYKKHIPIVIKLLKELREEL